MNSNQKTLVDAEFFYAIDNHAIGKYRKDSGARVGGWDGGKTGRLQHLNAGVVIGDRLYCAHSNFPKLPAESSVEIWDTATMQPVGQHRFAQPPGSLTWAVPRGGEWFACFAHYRPLSDPARAQVVRFDAQWQRLASWSFPADLIQRFAGSSASGGEFGPGGALFVTGHDARELYVLAVPDTGAVLNWTATIPISAEGQAFAWDPMETNVLYSISRPRREVIVSRITHAPATTPAAAKPAAAAPQLIAPDRTKHLVLDPRVIQSVTNAKLSLGTVEKDPHNPLFRADQPWENALNNLYPNVLWDAAAQRFKLWYKCVLTDKNVIAQMADPVTIHDQGWFLLYATSRDGLAWEKPAVGQFTFGGSRANNAVARDTPNVGVFRDPHDPDATRRFKMVYDVGLGKPRTRTSPDGVTWSEPQEPQGFAGYNCDTHNNAFWDERSGKYVWFTKAFLGERLVARFESTDFVKWKSSGVVLRSTVAEGRTHQTYCLPVFPYANGYLGFVMMYHAGTDRAVDCELAWSPDTVHWTRVAPGTPFIPRGAQGSYDSACIYAPSGPAIAQDGKLLIFYGGDFFPHQGWKRHCLPCLARVRVDGFAGYEPSTPGGEATVITQPLLVTGPLQVSADVRGSLNVSVLDEPGFTGAVVHGDVTDGEIKWPGRDTATLRGKMVRMKFTLRDAKLYAFRGLELVPAPVASTGVRHFTGPLDFNLSFPGPTHGVVLRHTTDGTEPTASSPVVRGPLRLAQTTHVRARAFLPGVTGGGPEFDAVFTRREPRCAFAPQPGRIRRNNFASCGADPRVDADTMQRNSRYYCVVRWPHPRPVPRTADF